MAALGITWVLDGLEVTLAGAVSGALKASPTLHLSDAEIGASASAYLAGAVLGAFFFGWLTDRLGRKRLFFVTLGVYIAATAASALAPDFAMFALFRFITGAGIGGEYTAINSALQELIPVHYRGRTDLAINGSFWLGALAGALGTTVLLEPGRFPPDLGWRLAFGIGAALGLGILLLRRVLPESPRWLLVHGRPQEAAAIVEAIERNVRGSATPADAPALSNFFGPLLLGRLFDTWGRKPMIALTYALSGLLLAGAALLFVQGALTAATQTLAWTIVFFFASAAASSAYLTVSESFPLEVRALAIALFYALGTALGGIAAPWIFGSLIGTGDPAAIGWGYVAGASLMLLAAGAELWLGVAAERRSLEDVARPLSCVDEESTITV